MNKQERFSLRKYKFGVASVLLGAILVFGTAQASAEEQAVAQTSAETQLVTPAQQAPAEKQESQVAETTNTVTSEKVAISKETAVAEKEVVSKEATVLEKTEAPKEGTAVPETKTKETVKPV